MKEKIIEDLVNQIIEEMSKKMPNSDTPPKEIIEQFKGKMHLDFEEEIKDLTEEESKYILGKFKTSFKQMASGYSMDDINYSEADKMSNINNYTITIKDDKRTYKLEELLEICSIHQLSLYNLLYSYMFNIYKVEKIKDKNKLIKSVKQDIIISLKKYIRKARNTEIELFKNALEKNGIINDIDADLIPLGFFIPYKLEGHKKRKYIMAKELLDILKTNDFANTSQETKDLVAEILQYFIASKGIVTPEEIEEFIIDVSDINIKKMGTTISIKWLKINSLMN